MSRKDRRIAARRWTSAAALVACMALVACGGSDSSKDGGTAATSGGSEKKLIIANISFACGLNDFARELCAGFDAVEQELPAGYELKVTNAIEFSDTKAFNNQVQTGLQLDPAGVILFPNGPSGQVPVLRQACDGGAKIIILDNAVEGLGDCQTSFISADNERLGVSLGRWLIAHPPESKEIGVANFPPGAAASTDARLKGFTETVTAAGFRIVATVSTDLGLDRTRTAVTNMLTAHPNIGTVFSTIDMIADGAAQAIGDKDIVQLSIDGNVSSVKRIPTGGLDADATQAPFWLARQSVLDMIDALEGKDIPAIRYEPSLVVDRTNAERYIADGGMREG